MPAGLADPWRSVGTEQVEGDLWRPLLDPMYRGDLMATFLSFTSFALAPVHGAASVLTR
jgi:hypothetical protein